MHHFILIHIDKHIEAKVKVNLTQEEIEEKYGKDSLD